jgi:hypothetical protein
LVFEGKARQRVKKDSLISISYKPLIRGQEPGPCSMQTRAKKFVDDEQEENGVEEENERRRGLRASRRESLRVRATNEDFIETQSRDKRGGRRSNVPSKAGEERPGLKTRGMKRQSEIRLPPDLVAKEITVLTDSTPSRRESGVSTPAAKGVNGSVLSKSLSKINTRGKSKKTSPFSTFRQNTSLITKASPCTPSPSSEEGSPPVESLSQLTDTLKESQARAASLSTNYSRLMRLIVDEELSSLDREIARARAGNHGSLQEKHRQLSEECNAKKEIAKNRLFAAEHEIDRRFEAMIIAEWNRFNVCIPVVGS